MAETILISRNMWLGKRIIRRRKTIPTIATVATVNLTSITSTTSIMTITATMNSHGHNDTKFHCRQKREGRM